MFKKKISLMIIKEMKVLVKIKKNNIRKSSIITSGSNSMKRTSKKDLKNNWKKKN